MSIKSNLAESIRREKARNMRYKKAIHADLNLENIGNELMEMYESASYGGRIFEGDIIRTDNGSVTAISVVKYGEYYPKMFYAMLDALKPHFQHVPTTGFYAESTDEHEAMMIFQSPCCEIIGNVYDNPGLLEGNSNETIDV